MIATLAAMLLAAGALAAALPLLRAIARRLLWRVRRKLTISYIFIGLVPAALIIVFFLLCGLLLFFNMGGYIVRTRAAAAVEEARLQAQAMAAGGPRASLPSGARASLVATTEVPPWLPRSRSHAVLVADAPDRPASLRIRAVAWLDSTRAVLVDQPFTPDVDPAMARADARLQWVTFLEAVDWSTGQAATITVPFRMDPAAVYRQIAGGPLRQMGAFDFGQFLLALVAAVAGLFLVIQVAALGTGLGLARTITGAVHDLFTGTERIRHGDFAYRIPIRRRDQLGALAVSFNAMAASIEDLLAQKAEKERLAQELQIARGIQMSLLPQGPIVMPGLAVSGFCEPAREVGGDYFDFLPIDDRRLGVLIADVAGKGTSAALYMAELKGLMLALGARHQSPRALLVEANRALSRHLDPRSFVTMTCLMVDLDARTVACARAGHCPLIYRAGTASDGQSARTVAPDGLMLGLQIDNGSMFDTLLQELTLPIAPGDLFVLYTDGITEASDASDEWFGDARLAAVVGAHGTLPLDELRARILAEVDAFTGGAPPHDDRTLVLMRVE